MRHQSGAVLVVALVILLVVTALGATAMRSATLEMRMASNSQERQQAHNAAEAALRKAEEWLDFQGNGDDPKVSCTGNGCYNNNCTGGYCFFGEWISVSGEQSQCKRIPSVLPSQTSPPILPVWENPTWDVWSNDSRHIMVDIKGLADKYNPKYIIEFQCFIDGFVPPTENSCAPDDLVCLSPCEELSNNCPAMYRITALGQSNSGRTKVMLQSVYRVNL